MKKVAFLLSIILFFGMAGCTKQNQTSSSQETSLTDISVTSESSMTSLEKDVLQEKIDLITSLGEKTQQGVALTGEEKEQVLATLTDLSGMQLNEEQQATLEKGILTLPQDLQIFAEQLGE